MSLMGGSADCDGTISVGCCPVMAAPAAGAAAGAVAGPVVDGADAGAAVGAAAGAGAAFGAAGAAALAAGVAGTAARTSETDLTASSAAMMAIVSGKIRGVKARSIISPRHPQRFQKVAFRLAADAPFDPGCPRKQWVDGFRRTRLNFAD